MGMICTGFAFGFAYLTCQPIGAPAQTAATYCAVAARPRADRSDSDRTKLFINREYAKWKALCGEKPAP